MSGIETQRSRIVFIRQCQRVPLGILQVPHPGQQGVGLAIAAATVGQTEEGITFQRKCAAIQVGNGISSGIINGQRICATQRKVSSKDSLGTSEGKGKTGQQSLAK